jgi:hypothetical protein
MCQSGSAAPLERHVKLVRASRDEEAIGFKDLLTFFKMQADTTPTGREPEANQRGVQSQKCPTTGRRRIANFHFGTMSADTASLRDDALAFRADKYLVLS